jgi:disulfide bond formation protein DsbB
MNIYQRIILVLGGIILAVVLIEGASEGTEVMMCGAAVIALTFSAYVGFKSRK